MAGIIAAMSTSPPAPSHYMMPPIGYVVSDFPDKFGVPRQPGLAPAARATLVLTPLTTTPWRYAASRPSATCG